METASRYLPRDSHLELRPLSRYHLMTYKARDKVNWKHHAFISVYLYRDFLQFSSWHFLSRVCALFIHHFLSDLRSWMVCLAFWISVLDLKKTNIEIGNESRRILLSMYVCMYFVTFKFVLVSSKGDKAWFIIITRISYQAWTSK